jgi:hypothetical protein
VSQANQIAGLPKIGFESWQPGYDSSEQQAAARPQPDLERRSQGLSTGEDLPCDDREQAFVHRLGMSV